MSGVDAITGAQRFAPILMLDRAEPFRPVQIGASVFKAEAQSPSSKFTVTPQGEICFEFAIFWDYDIGHLYDLEHIWVHISGGTVVAVEATFHGQRQTIDLDLADERPQVWCEAGKHAHFQNRDQRDKMAEATHQMSGPLAGQGGVHTGNPFSADFGDLTAHDHRLATLFLVRQGFEPAGSDALAWDLTQVPMVPWPDMPAFIADRMRTNIAKLRRDVPHMPAIFFDCGDTLVDEGTEVKRQDGSDVVIEASLIPGAETVIRELAGLGHRLCLVADGPRETFENVLKPSGLWDLFEGHVISGDIGVRKPDPQMFQAAREVMGLREDQAWLVPMVGNNLDRDIIGANRAGHPSLFFNWTGRRRRIPNGPEDTPSLTFVSLAELVPLLTAFEIALSQDTHP